MNRALGMLTALAMTTAALSGCAGGGGGDGGQSIDENATYDGANADQAYKVTGGLAGPGAMLSTGAVQFEVVDATTADDSAGALDKANLTLDVTEADGTRIQASLRAMVTAAEAGMTDADFFGGVHHNVEMHGDTGAGIPEFPQAKSHIFFAGLARVAVGGTPLDELQLVVAWAGKGIRAADGALLAEHDHGDLEVHVIFPGSLVMGTDPFNPGSNTEGFLYYYFERVELRQLTIEQKSAVGSGLQPPRALNKAPVAAASVVLADGTSAGGIAVYDKDKRLNVTLDASASTDEDGTIEGYSWQVYDLNETGGLTLFNKTSGVQVPMHFTSAGLKQIELRVIDDLGGIANITMFLFLNYQGIFAHQFSGGNGVGGGTTCQQGLNCLNHRVTLWSGAQQMTVKRPTPVTATGSTCDTASVQVRDPANAIIAGPATTGDLKIAKDKLAKVGAYNVDVWWRAQVQCGYTMTVTVDYAPLAA